MDASLAQFTHAELGHSHSPSHSLSLTLSLSLWSLRGAVQCQSLQWYVPFLPISGRLQRSVIREINGTAPIPRFVAFESAKLLCTSKKICQFIWYIYLASFCKCHHVHTLNNPPILYSIIHNPPGFTHSHTQYSDGIKNVYHVGHQRGKIDHHVLTCRESEQWKHRPPNSGIPQNRHTRIEWLHRITYYSIIIFSVGIALCKHAHRPHYVLSSNASLQDDVSGT